MTTDNLSKFGSAFQIKAISVMLTDRNFLDQASDIIDPKHFESDSHSWIVNRILWYFSAYKDLPSMDVFKKELDKITADDVLKVAIVSSLRDVYKNTTSGDISYIKDEYLAFCKNQALKNAILRAADKLQTGDWDGIKSLIDKAMTAGQERNYGHNWKEDMLKRLTRVARDTIPTGWDIIDQITDGGLGKGELGVIVAPPGIGKTWALASLGRTAIMNGKKVIHYSLELNENYLGLRYDTILTGIEPRDLNSHQSEVQNAIDSISGELIIKYFPTRSVNTNTLRAHVERMISISYVPDLILVDYADLMRPSERARERYQELGIVYEDLRGLAGELMIPIWTASQSQRASVKDDIIEGDKIAESFNKIMIADFILSISRKMTDKVSNTARIHIIKNRFGPDGLTFPALANFTTGQFEVYDDDSKEGVRIKKQMTDGEDVLKTLMKKRMLEFSEEENEKE